MRRGPKPAKSKEAKPPVARKSPKDEGSRVRELEARLEEALRGKAEALKLMAEALEQQTATAGILQVISNSPMDVLPTFEAIATAATRLCAAQDSGVVRFDGTLMHLMANDGFTAEERDVLRTQFPRPADRSIVTGRAIVTSAVAHVRDIMQDPDYSANAIQRGRFVRAILSVPMLRDGKPIGAITVTRREAEPFSPSQIAVLETFARQAVIAIENVRLFTELQSSNRELRTALDQQTATAEILRVISGSPTAVEPVFQAIVQSGLRLLGGYSAILLLVRGDQFHLAAFTSTGPHGDESVARIFPVSVGAEPLLQRAVRERRPVVVEDVETEPGFTDTMRHMIRARGWRSSLQMPMVRDTDVVGLVAITRREPGPFATDEVALLETFAAQAVIAIENVRLFKELEARNRDLTTALDQRTATAEILRVISSSPTDVQPTFDAIAENATRLCRGVSALVTRFDGELIHGVAYHDIGDAKFDAVRSVLPIRPGRGSLTGRAIESCRVVHIEDLTQDPEFEHTQVAQAGFRTGLAVPMLREGVPIGTITLSRMVVAPFTPGEIALLQTFADQAVIAIENVRLFKELEEKNQALTQAHAQVTEALDQQTATAEVLKVISRSTFDLQPVLETLVENAAKLCDAAQGAIFRVDGELLHPSAFYGFSPELQEHAPDVRAGRGSVVGRVALELRPVHVLDVLSDPEYQFADVQRLGGFRTILGIPMLRQGMLIGVFFISRPDVRAFTDKHIDLVTTFADQAVIAIENVRLFNETKEALEQQTATSEILRVISSSPTDVQPVFEAIADCAMRLCETYDVHLNLVEGDHCRRVMHRGPIDTLLTGTLWPMRGFISGRAVIERRTIHIADVMELDESEYPNALEAARRWGTRTALAIPLLREGSAIGVIVLRRREVRPFTDRQLALLHAFADQAVIAIENVRLFKELEARTADLTRSVEQLTALGEVGRAVSSTLDLQTVLTTIVGRAVELSGTSGGVIYEHDEATGEFRLRASHQIETVLVELLRGAPFRLGEGVTGRAAALRAPVQVMDLLTEREFALARISPIAEALGYRSVLAVPLLLEDRVMGGLTVWRKQPGDFAPEVRSRML